MGFKGVKIVSACFRDELESNSPRGGGGGEGGVGKWNYFPLG